MESIYLKLLVMEKNYIIGKSLGEFSKYKTRIKYT